MSLVGEDIPELIDGVDARTLPLSALEGFVLSRIDGTTSAKDIVEATGIGDELALSALEKLVSLGAVRMKSAAPAKPPPPRDSRPPNKRFGKPAPPPTQKVLTIPPPAGTLRRLYDPAELEEEVAIDDTRKRRVLDVFYRLGSGTHYELLEIGRDATKEEIREAYFSLSKEFHPDTAFGKDLGTYKSKMEKIFTAATGAYDVLSRRARKTEYDATLPPPSAEEAEWRARRPARPAPPEPRLPAPPLVPENVRQAAAAAKGTIHNEAPVRPRVAPPVPVPPAPVPPLAPPAPAAAPAPALPARPAEGPVASPTPPRPPPGATSSVPPQTPASPPSAEQIKRSQDLLKMRLAGGRPREGSSSNPDIQGVPAPGTGSESGVSRADVLRGLAGSLRDVSSVTGSGQSLRRHLATAVEAEREGNIKGALAALRLALALAPTDQRVADQLSRLESLRSVEEAPMFEARALAEEKAGQWNAAALSWLRVVEGRPNDSVAAGRCAAALLEANLDLKKARDLAQRALDADPNKVTSRTLLARIYVAAGMRSNAKRELDAATKLDPENEIVKNLLRELG